MAMAASTPLPTYEAEDGSGNMTTSSVTVTVPKSQGS